MMTRVPTLVLRKFKVNPNGGDEPCIEIIGRPSGLIAWILTLMGLNTETTLRVTDLAASIKRASLSGEFTEFVPLPHLSSTHCGFSKPISYLGAAAAAAFFGITTGMAQRDGTAIIVIGLIIALVFVIAYFLSKKIVIQLSTDGGRDLPIMFKPSVIEGVQVDIDFTIKALSLLNEKVLQAA